ncbi:lantibiotic dehydratase [Pedobacter sandarakinus]|uniref:lantibiotic dehydratase n=1 Tax=Pedobacter sandarakinus TaxID=353156 RepID=UPI002245D192|nr:lantibiotic dehydratase [Pedobacter sandarakinus]MCX2573272.1 thiopeptide-type bacteriocin biosynthesis protein [Pedobacter sandarakinus]
MKLHTFPKLIFRTPKFSYQANLSASWEQLKSAIAISSNDFYQTIKDIKADELNTLPPKIYFTIWKYFNRAKYRSTPYGTFASFTLLTDAIKDNPEEIVINESEKVHQFIDWPYKNQLQFNPTDIINHNCYLFSNSSHYETIDGLRYIACTDGIFELAEIGKDEQVKLVLDACLVPIKFNDLANKLHVAESDEQQLLSLLQDMHALQLIFTDQDPNIIGEDYFKRIGVAQPTDSSGYLIAERIANQGALDGKLLKAIPNMIDLLQIIVRNGERDALQQFVKRFSKKFEQQEISLLVALDPEMGVGYDELEQAGENDDFVAQFTRNKGVEKNNSLKEEIEKYLSKQSFEVGKTLFLNKLPLNLVENPKPLPNSFSLLMSVVDDLLVVDQIGGTTANALTGRFSLASQQVAHYCKEIAQIEQNANPDVAYFDVAYMVETNVDNINRRKLIYDHQLSILNFDTSIDPLSLEDIQISVRGGQVILRSKKLNKRIVPRMASAYNYTRSDLSVFRLLCDLQYQAVNCSLSLPLDAILPDLTYYPRFQFQNILLSTQKWRVQRETFYTGKVPIGVTDCRNYLKSLHISKYFKAGVSDQTLCFDIDSDDDLIAFIRYMQKQQTIYLEEVILPGESLVKDGDGKPYLAQFILSLTHQDNIYKPVKPGESTSHVKRFFLPGEEWLYFEIFCHEQRSDEILANVIDPFLNEHSTEIASWFFIRYNENGNHLRVRFKLANQHQAALLTSAFYEYLNPYLTAGLVSDVQLKTYKRELERYGVTSIEMVEAHFMLDSAFVLSIVPAQPDGFSKYKYASYLINYLQQAEIFSSDVLSEIVKWMSNSFNTEHQLNASDYKRLNQQYQLYKSAPIIPLDQQQQVLFSKLAKSFAEIIMQAEESKKRTMLTDLIHMFVNRMFNKEQRTNEMIMYYFLLKDLQRKTAIEKS